MTGLQTLVESLEYGRLKWLKINLAGFAVWDGIRIADSYLLDGQYHQLLTGIMIFSWLLWLVSLMQIVRLSRKVKSHKLTLQIFDDELIRIDRLKTWRFALIAVAATQIFIVLVSLVHDIPGILAAELSIFVMVTSSISGFIYYNTK